MQTLRIAVLQADEILETVFEDECKEHDLDPTTMLVEFDIEDMAITSYILIEPHETAQDLANRDNAPTHIEIDKELLEELKAHSI